MAIPLAQKSAANNRIDIWITQWRSAAQIGLKRVADDEQLKYVDMYYTEDQAKAYLDLFFAVTGLFFPLAGVLLNQATAIGKTITKAGIAFDIASKARDSVQKGSKITGKTISKDGQNLKKVLISRNAALKAGNEFLNNQEAKLRNAMKKEYYRNYHFLDTDPFGQKSAKLSKRPINYIALDFAISSAFKTRFIVYKSNIHNPCKPAGDFDPNHYYINKSEVAKETYNKVSYVLLITKIKACREKIQKRTRFMQSHHHHEWTTKEIEECKGLSEKQKHRMPIPT